MGGLPGSGKAARAEAVQKQRHSYQLFLVHEERGGIRKLRVPPYLIYAVLLAAVVGAGTLLAGVASYTHLLFKVTRYDQVAAERRQLLEQNRVLQSSFAQSQTRLTTLESLANEVAATYGLLRLRQTPFGTVEAAGARLGPEDEFRDTLARYRYLRRHASAVTLYAGGARPLPGQDLTQLTYTPSLWPVRGHITAGFGDRLDPFNGEGTFHAGVDISTEFGNPVLAAADGFVVAVGQQSGYGRVVVVDHGAGITTWYAHLSRFRAYLGQSVQRGEVVGYVGSSGRATGPHLHYEVRLQDTPVNPWRFLRTGPLYASNFPARGGD